MRALLDGHALIWMANDPDRLGGQARETVLDVETSLYVSMATFWELAVKISLGKLSLDGLTLNHLKAYCIDNAISFLPIQYQHCLQVVELPFFHRDPFDRLLIGQARVEELSLISKDRLFKKYLVDVVW